MDGLDGITFFTIPRAFVREFKTIQHNAIKSWAFVDPGEIVLCGWENGAEIAALLYKCRILSVERTPAGVPLVNDAIKAADSYAHFPIKCFINCDNIILPERFMAAVSLVAKEFLEFVIVGQRRNIDMADRLEHFDGDWETRLLNQSTKWNNDAIEYFVYRGDPWGIGADKIPPFAVGREHYDHWLIYSALQKGIPVIDATDHLVTLHQNHKGKPGATKEEFRENRKFVDFSRCGIEAASWRLHKWQLYRK